MNCFGLFLLLLFIYFFFFLYSKLVKWKAGDGVIRGDNSFLADKQEGQEEIHKNPDDTIKAQTCS